MYITILILNVFHVCFRVKLYLAHSEPDDTGKNKDSFF